MASNIVAFVSKSRLFYKGCNSIRFSKMRYSTAKQQYDIFLKEWCNLHTSATQLANIDPRLSIGMDPQAHHNLRPEMMFIREELRQAKMQTLAVRRMALKKLLLKDLMQEDCELRNIGLAYALRYP